MFRNYLKIALRSVLKHKAYSIINISGLAIGMASCILILLWVQNELSYDKWHAHAKRIYRINTYAGDFKTALAAPAMTQAYQSAMPAIKHTVRLSEPAKILFSIGERKFEESRVFYADSTFLQVFSFPLVKGDVRTALERPDAVLITEDMAKKYFGKEDPLGKVLRKDNDRDVVVTGVLANIPSNSHLQFDFILPYSSPEGKQELAQSAWNNLSYYDYIQLADQFNATPAALADMERQMNEIFKRNDKLVKVDIHLQPMTRIHLYSDLQFDLQGRGNIQYVNIFFVVALFILAVACINFMNLATARSARRAKEVGLRKVVGAVRRQLMIQFLGESLLISFFSLLAAIVIVYLALPIFNELAGKQLTLSLWNGGLLAALLGICIAVGLVAGSYPAVFLSGFQPVKVLKGNLGGLGGNRVFRNVLVVVQFVVSIVLLIGTIVIYKQLNYIRNRNMGYEKENLLYMGMRGNVWNKKQALYDALAQDPATSQFTVVSDLPTDLTSGTVEVNWPGKGHGVQIVFPSMYVSESFFDIFKMKMISGRAFSKAFKSDSSNFVLNETAAHAIGMTAASAIGKPISFGDTKGVIVGVVEDFNFKPIQHKIDPLVIQLNKWGGVVVVRTRPGAAEAAIQRLAAISQELEPAFPFNYGFMDQSLDSLYKGEQQIGKVFNLFALLGVLIACLGLYGLSAYIAEQKTKEIGVRKVLGASLIDIVRLLSADFTRLILVAAVLAIPLAWWAVNEWLKNFAYHIQVGWSVFLLAPVAALLMAWLTVSYESVKAGMANPVKSLKAE